VVVALAVGRDEVDLAVLVDEPGEDRISRPQVGDRRLCPASGSVSRASASPSRALTARSSDAAMQVKLGVSRSV
jgi:hypothetical protein